MNLESPCELWVGRLNKFGYGTISGKLAHRVAWEAVHGPIAGDLTIDHVCHDPKVCRLGKDCPHRRCVNVDHFELVTAAENKARGGLRGWRVTHCRNGHSYSGDNLIIYDGARYCRTCRSGAERGRRLEARLKHCRDAGHERVTAIDAIGREYCVHCRAAHGEALARANRGSGRGRDLVRATATRRAREARQMAASCRTKGHERQEGDFPSGRRLCVVCTAALPGRPRKHDSRAAV